MNTIVRKAIEYRILPFHDDRNSPVVIVVVVGVVSEPLTVLISRADGVTNRGVCPQLDARVGSLSSPGPHDALPESTSPLLGKCGSDRRSQSVSRDLHPRLDELDGVGEIHGKDARSPA